jgi:hypothetical protein
MFASGSLTLAGMHTIKRPACNGQGNILNHFQRINDAFPILQKIFPAPGP